MAVKAYWRQGSKFSVNPTTAFREMERIKKINGGSLVPSIVVIEAKKASNPLHKDIYKLSDTDAAMEHRLEIARKMLRSIEVIHNEAPQHKMRAYEVVTEEAVRDEPERKVYKSMSEIMQDPISRDELLSRAIREAFSYRKKYHALQELAGIFSALDEFLEKNMAV